MVFYVLFEVSIIPIYFIVLGWGNQPERLMAANYLVIYTLMFSFPLLVLVIRFLVDCSVVGWASVVWVDGVVMVVMLLPFVVKLPVYLFHLWLPKAHVEAPVLGRMILASILLKTGGYGLIKVGGLSVGSDCVFGLVGLLLFLSLMSAVTTVVQNDLKKFVAYSSVTHITMVLGLVVMGFGVLDSAVVCLMLSHGVLSNSMFFMVVVSCVFMVGMFSNSSKTRLLFKQQGLLQLSPVVWFFLVFLLFMSSRVPPSVGMVGEGAINLVRLVALVGVVVVIVWLVLAVGEFGIAALQVMSFVVSLSSAMTTIMMNRVGDFALMVMVVTLGCSFVFDYEYVIYGSLRLAMFLGAMVAKRAQVPMGRVVWVNGLLIILGLLTRLYASLMAFFEFDLKKILAYSTMSQIAIVMLMLLSGMYSLIMIHVMNHALVKALLFMNVGIVMSVSFVSVQVMVVPVLVMGWFLIMNFSMPCDPCFDVFKAFLLVTPFVIMLFVLKVFILSFVKGMHVSGVMSLVNLVGFNVRLKMEKHRFEEPGILEGE
ncbi:NADH-ubiquinone oxidoreductase chain 4 [Trichinella britovi]|uniref:NADH-ubiquinone oxidoreductase chain 4 n=1 Tax=Trichinella britovi TaxID=45882 RepID=A0A0V1CBS8_TRIBR|nr:NADH-ubiquinone oxidoreductase chain 4 [Trichinella britovi]